MGGRGGGYLSHVLPRLRQLRLHPAGDVEYLEGSLRRKSRSSYLQLQVWPLVVGVLEATHDEPRQPIDYILHKRTLSLVSPVDRVEFEKEERDNRSHYLLHVLLADVRERRHRQQVHDHARQDLDVPLGGKIV